MAKRPAAAQTAFGPMVIVTVEQHYPQAQRLIQDDLAYQFLPLGMQVATRLCAWNVVRDLLIKLSERQAPGIWGSVLCRKRYADEKVAGAVAAGVDAVVVLGAGLDTRTYRLAAPAGVAAFEVDLPTNIDDKRAKVQRLYGRIPEHVTLVPIDFEIDNLGEVLAARGLDVAKRILFVWEAVTQYLTDRSEEHTSELQSRVDL